VFYPTANQAQFLPAFVIIANILARSDSVTFGEILMLKKYIGIKKYLYSELNR
jgi:hypothetical protein